jgi:hypothetical protein
MFQSLNDIERDIVSRLEDAAKNRKSPMHTPVIGTADADVRVMVLREFDRTAWAMRLHTDARSPKAITIAGGSPVGVLLYDAAEKIQIRAKGTGRIETNTDAAAAAWNASTNFARRCYLAEAAPGDSSPKPTSGLPEWIEGEQPTAEQVAPAQGNFAILMIELNHIDWLYLANSGHRRAQFHKESSGSWNGSWVVP